jgi:hypothetical protein
MGGYFGLEFSGEFELEQALAFRSNAATAEAALEEALAERFGQREQGTTTSNISKPPNPESVLPS